MWACSRNLSYKRMEENKQMPATEIFIGREKISERLRRDVFRVSNGSYGHCYSLIGPNGIGRQD